MGVCIWKQRLDSEDAAACVGLTAKGFSQRDIAAILCCTQRAVMIAQREAGVHNARRSRVTPFVDLPREEIELRCLEVQQGWDDETRERRRVQKEEQWEPPLCRLR